MATIVIVPYPEPGHIDPSFKIARILQSRGHRVCYLNLADYDEYIGSRGLEFIPIFENLCPRGFVDEQAECGVSNFEAVLSKANKASMENGYDPAAEIHSITRSIQPDLFIIDTLLPDLALLIQRLGIPILLYNALLFNPWARGDNIYSSLLKLPELILCPKEFDFPQTADGGERHYIEPVLDLEKRDVPFAWEKLDPKKPLIYCSLGSQSHLYGWNKEFFQTAIDTMALMPDRQMVIATGLYTESDSFRNIPPNAIVVKWVPQMELLQRTSIAITHGGMNTIKSCIFFGVPIIIFPIDRETPMNAARILYHGLGVRGNIKRNSVQHFQSLIKEIDGNPLLRLRVELMGKKLRQLEASGRGVQIIESILDQISRHRSGQQRLENLNQTFPIAACN